MSPSTLSAGGPLDFPADRTTVRIREVAARLGVSDSLVENWIDAGELVAIDISTRGAKASRRSRRVPVASYQEFIRRRASVPGFLNGTAATLSPNLPTPNACKRRP